MKTVKKILILMIITVLLISLHTIVYAAGSYSVSASSKSLTPGKTATLTIKTTNAEGKFNVTSSNPGVVAVGTSSLWVSSSENITLTAKAAGTATITATTAATIPKIAPTPNFFLFELLFPFSPLPSSAVMLTDISLPSSSSKTALSFSSMPSLPSLEVKQFYHQITK